MIAFQRPLEVSKWVPVEYWSPSHGEAVGDATNPQKKNNLTEKNWLYCLVYYFWDMMGVWSNEVCFTYNITVHGFYNIKMVVYFKNNNSVNLIKLQYRPAAGRYRGYITINKILFRFTKLRSWDDYQNNIVLAIAHGLSLQSYSASKKIDGSDCNSHNILYKLYCIPAEQKIEFDREHAMSAVQRV